MAGHFRRFNFWMLLILANARIDDFLAGVDCSRLAVGSTHKP